MIFCQQMQVRRMQDICIESTCENVFANLYQGVDLGAWMREKIFPHGVYTAKLLGFRF
jgi:hypothetical protein